MSWKPEVIADDSGQWTSNGHRFATEAEAMGWVKDLSARWLLVTAIRASESTDEVNSRRDPDTGATTAIEPAPAPLVMQPANTVTMTDSLMAYEFNVGSQLAKAGEPGVDDGEREVIYGFWRVGTRTDAASKAIADARKVKGDVS